MSSACLSICNDCKFNADCQHQLLLPHNFCDWRYRDNHVLRISEVYSLALYWSLSLLWSNSVKRFIPNMQSCPKVKTLPECSLNAWWWKHWFPWITINYDRNYCNFFDPCSCNALHYLKMWKRVSRWCRFRNNKISIPSCFVSVNNLFLHGFRELLSKPILHAMVAFFGTMDTFHLYSLRFCRYPNYGDFWQSCRTLGCW